MPFDTMPKETVTKHGVFTVDGIAVWLAEQVALGRANDGYCYEKTGGCLLWHYFMDRGLRNVAVGGFTVDYARNGRRAINHDLGALGDISHGFPRTYGAALERARALQNRGG